MKSKKVRALERKLRRLSKSLRAAQSDAFGLVADAREAGCPDEHVGAVMIAVEALFKASARMSSAVRDLERPPQGDAPAEPEPPAPSQPLALARYVPGTGYVLNGRIVG